MLKKVMKSVIKRIDEELLEMEKNQIIKSYNAGAKWGSDFTSEDYYKQQFVDNTPVICSDCEGNGYTIEVEGECCWNTDYIERYGSCCGVPNPVQVQVECRKCQNGYILAE